MARTYGPGIVATEHGRTLRVEVADAANAHGTRANYGTVVTVHYAPGVFAYQWSVASGQRGELKTRAGAVRAAARAIRAHGDAR